MSKYTVHESPLYESRIRTVSAIPYARAAYEAGRAGEVCPAWIASDIGYRRVTNDDGTTSPGRAVAGHHMRQYFAGLKAGGYRRLTVEDCRNRMIPVKGPYNEEKLGNKDARDAARVDALRNEQRTAIIRVLKALGLPVTPHTIAQAAASSRL